MIYSVQISSRAESDLREIYEYIAYVLEKVHDRLFLMVQKSFPHYLSVFRNTLSRKNQKLPIKFIKDFSFDSIFLSL